METQQNRNRNTNSEYENESHIAAKKKAESRTKRPRFDAYDEMGFDDEEEAAAYTRYLK
jgi:hypothetical protein